MIVNIHTQLDARLRSKNLNPSNSKTKIVLNLEPHEAERCAEVLNLTDTELHKIKNFDRGHGLLSSNGNNIAVHFQASALENSLITTDPEELRLLAAQKGVQNASQRDVG